MRLLVSDVGGTHARLAVVEAAAGAVRIDFERDYPTARYPGLEAVLEVFLGELGAAPGVSAAFEQAAFAIAGPVAGEHARLTNVPSWRLERAALESAVGVRTRLLNDFEALAHGVIGAAPGELAVLQRGTPVSHAPLAILGAGTGLGVAGAAWDGARYRPFTTEAGHIGFAPANDMELQVWRHLRERLGRVSWERVVSGPGLAAIYEALRAQQPPAGPVEPAAEPAAVSARGLAEPASLAGRALDLFVACYGAFAGDIALAWLARGGVALCGHIAATLASRLGQGDFLTAFNAKGRHEGLMRTIPVSVATSEKLGLLGAARSILSNG